MNTLRAVIGMFISLLLIPTPLAAQTTPQTTSEVFLFQDDNCQVEIYQERSGIRGGVVEAKITVSQINLSAPCDMNGFRIDIFLTEQGSRPASFYNFVVDVDQPHIHWTISDFGDSFRAVGATTQTETVHVLLKIHTGTTANQVRVGYSKDPGYFWFVNILIIQNLVYLPFAQS